MKIENYQFPKSSFLSMDKDMELIVNKILKNDRLKKLLYYTSRDALDKPNLTEDETLSLFDKNIQNTPKLQVHPDVRNYLLINFDNFVQNSNNPEFRDNIIEFDILCHFDQWKLNNFSLRPYKIAGELDSMLNERHLTGIGNLQFFGANQININQEFGGLCLMYAAIHGGEDKYDAIPPKEDKDIVDNFNKIFNEKWIEDQH